MTIRIDEDTAVEMLVQRVKFWTDDDTVISLYEKMYENSVYGGAYDGGTFDVKEIVDNDYVNWCKVISEGDDEYDDIKALYDEDGLADISCADNNHGISYIEAEYMGNFLVRY